MLGSQNFAEEQHRARQRHGKAREPLAQRTPIILSYHPQPPPLSLWPPSVTTLAFTRSPFLVSTVPRTRPSLAFNRRDMPSGAALNHQLPQSKHQPSITFTSAGPSTLISQAPGAATSSAIPDSVAVRGGRRRIGKRQNNLHFSSCCFVVVVVGGGGGGGSSPVLHEGSSCDLSDMLRLANEPDRPPPAWPDPGFCPSPRVSRRPKRRRRARPMIRTRLCRAFPSCPSPSALSVVALQRLNALACPIFSPAVPIPSGASCPAVVDGSSAHGLRRRIIHPAGGNTMFCPPPPAIN